MNLDLPQRVFLALFSLCIASNGVISAQIDPDPIPTQKPEEKKPVTIQDALRSISAAEPIRRAGLRVNLINQTKRVIPAVVIVRDEYSYLEALSSWEGPVRFPILYDDGSVRSREHIARFVRGFKPEKVLEFSSADPGDLGGPRKGREEKISAALSRAINDQAPTWEDSFDELYKNEIYSPGIVVIDATDPSWAAGLALAAGRLQPIMMINTPPTEKGKDLSAEQADLLESQIESEVESMGFAWDEMGDEIDAITLALNIPTRINTGAMARDDVATTDRIGRKDAGGQGTRWAYSGQIIGDISDGVYQAMCSLFLGIDSAFLWDGYTNKEPWVQYDMTRVAAELDGFGIESELHDQPNYTRTDWRYRMLRPVDASLILINSKGSLTRFDLPGGGAAPGDLPVLERPSVIHMVHSFSMQDPTNEGSIGGRLLARGVYAYAGSVDEPYLNAFVPQPLIARRLGASFNFASAIRYDDGKVWKIAVLGDPLVTIGSTGLRVDMPKMSDDFVDVAQRASERIKGGEYADGMGDLVLLGRDRDVARLAIALMNDRPDEFTNACAAVAIPSIFREGDHPGVINAFERLGDADRGLYLMQDLLWFSSRLALERGSDLRVEAMLLANLRSWQAIADAEELAIFVRRRSLPDAIAMLESVRGTLPSAGQRDALDRAMKRVRGN